jgi:hypothetical protein
VIAAAAPSRNTPIVMPAPMKASPQSKPLDVAQLGAQTEAKGYRAIVRYQEQLAASPVTVSSPSSGFDWGDAFIGAGMTIGVFLLGAAAAITARRRQGLARLRP